MRLGIGILLFVGIIGCGFSQDTLSVSEETAMRSKSLIIDLGLNNFYHNPDRLGLKTEGSRGANIYLYHKINPKAEHVLFRIGFGLGLDNYSFKNDVNPIPRLDSTVFYNGNSVGVDSIEFIKSKISMNHFDIPFEVVFQSKNKSGAFKFALGARVGWVFDAHTKRVSEVNGSKNTEKMKADFNIQKMRYGLTARVMYSGFNFFFMHNLSPVFQKDKGPDLPNFMAGFSLLID